MASRVEGSYPDRVAENEGLFSEDCVYVCWFTYFVTTTNSSKFHSF